jgi:hypothetical protein
VKESRVAGNRECVCVGMTRYARIACMWVYECHIYREEEGTGLGPGVFLQRFCLFLKIRE